MLVYLLLEFSVIIHSTNTTLLSQTILFLLQVIKPLRYPYPAIVDLPEEMALMLESPFPTLIGVSSSKQFCLEETQIYFDLDSKIVVNRT